MVYVLDTSAGIICCMCMIPLPVLSMHTLYIIRIFFSNTIFSTLHTVTVNEQSKLTIEGMVCDVLVCYIKKHAAYIHNKYVCPYIYINNYFNVFQNVMIMFIVVK